MTASEGARRRPPRRAAGSAAIRPPDRESALEARVLRPPGLCGFPCNRYDTSIDWQRHLRNITGTGMMGRGPLDD
ncbi:MAG TPA: hypothetical protein VHA80_12255 [Solirubrobacterales bacterium]|nr:hypothetical protein [Solirubrobacterales bacterium]